MSAFLRVGCGGASASTFPRISSQQLQKTHRLAFWHGVKSLGIGHSQVRMQSTKKPAVKHLLQIDDFTKEEVIDIMKVAAAMKASRKEFDEGGVDTFSKVLEGRTLLMLFEKPSLRTRVSLETGMHQMGGHGIMYSIADSPLGKKESIEDTAKVLSRMCQGITARVNRRQDVSALAMNSTIPVMNALDDYAHPMQMLADLQTIIEHKGTWEGLTMAYVGDLANNMTYDLMRLASLMGFNLNLAGACEIEESVWDECKKLQAATGAKIQLWKTVEEALTDVDIVYCDSWMSYGIPAAEEEERKKMFMPYQVTADLMQLTKPGSIFMNCLPAMRGMEQTGDVIDGPHSIVFDQAENRLHAQKAMLVRLLVPKKFSEILSQLGK